jgi:hypothetical protein
MLKNKIEEVKNRVFQLEITILGLGICEAKELEFLGIQSVYQADYEEAEDEQDEKEMLAILEANESTLLSLIDDYK